MNNDKTGLEKAKTILHYLWSITIIIVILVANVWFFYILFSNIGKNNGDGEKAITEVCSECGERYNVSQLSQKKHENNKWYCSDCAWYRELYKCIECGYLVEYDEYEEINDGDYYICEDCINNSENAKRCDNCGIVIYKDYMESAKSRNGDTICKRCISNGYYSHCAGCDTLEKEDELYYSEYFDDYVCDECYEEHK